MGINGRVERRSRRGATRMTVWSAPWRAHQPHDERRSSDPRKHAAATRVVDLLAASMNAASRCEGRDAAHADA